MDDFFGTVSDKLATPTSRHTFMGSLLKTALVGLGVAAGGAASIAAMGTDTASAQGNCCYNSQVPYCGGAFCPGGTYQCGSTACCDASNQQWGCIICCVNKTTNTLCLYPSLGGQCPVSPAP